MKFVADRPFADPDDAARIADAVLNKVKHFTIGFGRAGRHRARREAAFWSRRMN